MVPSLESRVRRLLDRSTSVPAIFHHWIYPIDFDKEGFRSNDPDPDWKPIMKRWCTCRTDKWIVPLLAAGCFFPLLVQDLQLFWWAPATSEIPKLALLHTDPKNFTSSSAIVDNITNVYDNATMDAGKIHFIDSGNSTVAQTTPPSTSAVPASFSNFVHMGTNHSGIIPTHNDESPSTRNKTTFCRFEDAKGYYNTTVNGNLTYDWIHNHSSSLSRPECVLQNHLEAIRTGQYDDRQSKKPLAFLTIGDSLDRYMVSVFIRKTWENSGGFRMVEHTNLDPNNSIPLELNNTRHNHQQTAPICSNGIFSFAQFANFGMHHSCHNQGNMLAIESRATNTSAERVEKFLAFDILSRLSPDTNYVVMVSSCLWDLSDGCNDQLGVSDDYRKLYRQGMLDMHKAIQKTLPGSPIYWHTSPSVSVNFDLKATQKGFGKNRANQEILNDILRKTVSEYDLGFVVDWWEQANQRPESNRDITSDGMHYSVRPSLAFYNLFLNAVFDHHPELMRWQ